jgi:hypothetical protein
LFLKAADQRPRTRIYSVRFQEGNCLLLNWGALLWPRLDPLKRLMSIARKYSLDLTIEDAKHHNWEGCNFLDKAALTKKAAKVYSSLDTELEKQREAVRKKIAQNLN